MLRDFKTRSELVTYLREQFPQAADDHVSNIPGGRKAAEEALREIDPVAYAKTRNFLDGNVTKLSAYIRHGVLSLGEIREYVLKLVEKPDDAHKLIQELAWRDYWQRLYVKLGNGIWQNQEEYKTGYLPTDYTAKLPEDISTGTTGLVCIDSFSQELRTTGYLHNHIRMWLAAYIIHWRRVQWQAGAKWFLQHLLDGDPASNNMSWQWVASTFSHKPYFFNRDNLERHTRGIYCRKCPYLGKCDLEGSYEQIEQRLFPKAEFSKQHHSQTWQKGNKRK
ncbi:MAG: FAD-binding domain-containing protein [Dolichospermum sp.]